MEEACSQIQTWRSSLVRSVKLEERLPIKEVRTKMLWPIQSRQKSWTCHIPTTPPWQLETHPSGLQSGFVSTISWSIIPYSMQTMTTSTQGCRQWTRIWSTTNIRCPQALKLNWVSCLMGRIQPRTQSMDMSRRTCKRLSCCLLQALPT